MFVCSFCFLGFFHFIYFVLLIFCFLFVCFVCLFVFCLFVCLFFCFVVVVVFVFFSLIQILLKDSYHSPGTKWPEACTIQKDIKYI